MAAHFVIAGRKFHRRSTLRLRPEEKARLAATGRVILHRPVEWPLPDRQAFMERAWVDQGGTDVWGSGPYLKVPNRHPLDADDVVNRVFCPWGYPPTQVRLKWSTQRARIVRVTLSEGRDPGTWDWVLTLENA